MKRIRYLHPFLFAFFPVVSLYQANITQTAADVVIIPLIVVLLFTGLILVLSRLALTDPDRSSLSTSLLILLVFLYGPLAAAFKAPELVSLLVWTVVYLLLLFLVIRANNFLPRLRVIANAIGLTLVIVPLIQVVVYHLQNTTNDPHALSSGATGTPAVVEQASEQPDIYYLIFDRHARNDTLASIYQYDNSAFTDFLTDRGFTVADQSNSNYLVTSQSLASSLNMDYLDDLTSSYGPDHDDWLPIFERIHDNQVAALLQQRGYTFINMGSWWTPTRNNAHAQINVKINAPSDFSLLLFGRTVFKPLGQFMHIEDLLVLDQRQYHYLNALNQFSNLAKVPSIEAPTFTFAHVLLPHEPYVFDADGKRLTYAEAMAIDVNDGYINQLIYTDKEIEKVVSAILKDSSKPPIIIIQADEGPFPRPWKGVDDKFNLNFTTFTDTELIEKTGIINAFYGEKLTADLLYPSITPVNTFRVVFNQYFGTDYELLPDRVYLHPNVFRPYDFQEINARVRPPTPLPVAE